MLRRFDTFDTYRGASRESNQRAAALSISRCARTARGEVNYCVSAREGKRCEKVRGGGRRPLRTGICCLEAPRAESVMIYSGIWGRGVAEGYFRVNVAGRPMRQSQCEAAGTCSSSSRQVS